MATVDLTAFKSACQRRGLVGASYIASYESPAVKTITSGASKDFTIPEGYVSNGKLSPDGISVSSEQEKSEQKGWGDSTASRIDIDSETNQVTYSGMETNALNLALWNNRPIGTIKATEGGGIVIDRPKNPTLINYRYLGVIRDVNKKTGAYIYFGLHFPMCNVSRNGEQQFNNDESGILYPFTVDSLHDDTEGTAFRFLFDGPGVDAEHLADMGIETS